MSPTRQARGGGSNETVAFRATDESDAAGLEALQSLVFPTLDDRQRFKREHYLRHLEVFPEGQFVAVDCSSVPECLVGMTSSLRLNFDFSRPDHRFEDVAQGGWLAAHDASGRWLYGADIGTHPDYRRRGIARGLYRLRHQTVRRLELAGQLTVGMMRGYGLHRDRMSPQRYYEGILSGAIYDPTISTQMKLGFEPRGLIEDYVNDPVCDGWGVLLVVHRDCDIPPRA